MAVESISIAAATEYRNARIEEGARNRTVKNELSFLKRLLMFAHEWQDVTGVAGVRLAKLPTIRRDERRGVALTEAELFRLLSTRLHRDTGRVHRILVVGVTTMLRRAVLLGLRWEWIDVGRKWLEIPAKFMKGRGGERRGLSVPLSDWTLEALGRPRASGWVFPNPQTGGRTKMISGSLVTLATQAGVPAFTLHDLRRTGTTWLENRGVNRLTRKVLLGHKTDVDVTDLYTHQDEAVLRAGVATFDVIRKAHGSNHGSIGRP